MIENDVPPKKSHFWLAWIVANAVGLGFAWPLGEIVGRYVSSYDDWKSGQLLGIIVFEGFIWIVRAAVLFRIKSYIELKPIAMAIWLGTEIIGWILSEGLFRDDNLLSITGGVLFASLCGSIMWLIFWFIKIPKRRSKTWAIQAFLWALLGMIGGALLLSIFLTAGLSLAEIFAKMSYPIVGMAAGGLILGGFIGIVTGMALIKLLRWQRVAD
jgi:hypothetical protein